MASEGGTAQKPSISLVTENPQLITDVLEAHRGECHVVVVHDFPDPDAISSAFAHQLLSDKYDIGVDIVYRGKISHQQNIAMTRLLGIDLTHFDDALDLDKYDAAVFIDNQGTTAEEIVKKLEALHVPTLIIVDHHEPQDRIHAEFTDIRQVGASATIYTEYIQQALDLSESRKEYTMVATALLHGIECDAYVVKIHPTDT